MKLGVILVSVPVLAFTAVGCGSSRPGSPHGSAGSSGTSSSAGNGSSGGSSGAAGAGDDRDSGAPGGGANGGEGGASDADGGRSGAPGGGGGGASGGIGGSAGSGGQSSSAMKRIFATRSAYGGDLKTAGGSSTSGLEGADNLCAINANAALLGGSWKVWLSDSQTNAIDRINDVGPWYLVDGSAVVFNNKANLATSPITDGIQMDENGLTGDWEPNPGVWTGTGLGGMKKADPRDVDQTWCSDWSSDECLGIFGNLTAGDQVWTDWATGVGNIPNGHLYCIEQ